jgi:hypothetical protein
MKQKLFIKKMLNIHSYCLITFPFIISIQNCIDFTLFFINPIIQLVELSIQLSNACISLDLDLVILLFSSVIGFSIPFVFFAGRAGRSITDKNLKGIQIGAGSVIIGRGAIDGYNS